MNFNTILIPVLFALGIGIILKSLISSRGISYKKKLSNFTKEEIAANKSKNIPISEELFMIPKLDFANEFKLENKLLKELKISIDEKANEPMILQKKESNIELKKQYGSATVKKIAEYEENYYKYIHSLNIFAEILIKENLLNEAKETLDYTILHMKSDLKKSLELRERL